MAELNLHNFNLLLLKSEGRDKLARFIQYSARALVGFAAVAAPKSGTFLHKWEGHARTTMVNLAGARRTHRWCKEFPVIKSIPKSFAIKDPVELVLDLLQKVSLATFMIIDHVGHMKQWKIFPGGKRSGAGTIQLGLKFFCFSNFISALIQMKKYLVLSASAEDKRKEQFECVKQTMKHLLLVVQTAHLSMLYQSHDALVGVAGMLTSSMDVRAQWPAAPAAPAVASPPAPAPPARAAVDSSSSGGERRQVKSS